MKRTSRRIRPLAGERNSGEAKSFGPQHKLRHHDASTFVNRKK